MFDFKMMNDNHMKQWEYILQYVYIAILPYI